MVKLFSKNFNLCDHNSPTSQTDGQIDRQTDRRHAIAIPRFALGASRFKNGLFSQPSLVDANVWGIPLEFLDETPEN